jgi:hypothetical protein
MWVGKGEELRGVDRERAREREKERARERETETETEKQRKGGGGEREGERARTRARWKKRAQNVNRQKECRVYGYSIQLWIQHSVIDTAFNYGYSIQLCAGPSRSNTPGPYQYQGECASVRMRLTYSAASKLCSSRLGLCQVCSRT